jgi:hypothetical protein
MLSAVFAIRRHHAAFLSVFRHYYCRFATPPPLLPPRFSSDFISPLFFIDAVSPLFAQGYSAGF